MAIEMMSISHCYCSDYMTKPTQFGDEPKLSSIIGNYCPRKQAACGEKKNKIILCGYLQEKSISLLFFLIFFRFFLFFGGRRRRNSYTELTLIDNKRGGHLCATAPLGLCKKFRKNLFCRFITSPELSCRS